MSSTYNISLESAITLPILLDKLEVYISILID